ncbi:MAG: hypothetical protein ACE5HV_11840 [Acidobacteriota bacterium]
MSTAFFGGFYSEKDLGGAGLPTGQTGEIIIDGSTCAYMRKPDAGKSN